MALPPGYKTTAECWQEYPKLPFPDSVSRGKAQNRARDACVAASMQGKPDPKLDTGPAILRDPVALWRSKEPWNERPHDGVGRAARLIGRMIDPGDLLGGIKTDGDVVRSQAIGWQPGHDTRFKDIERKATIRGGIDALGAAGIHPWVPISVAATKLKPTQLKNDMTGVPLVGLTQNAAQALGLAQPTGLQAAAEFVRQQVNANGLERAAWAARTVHLAMAGVHAQKQRQAVESSVAAATSLASGPLAVIPPVGLALFIVSLAYTTAGARTSAEQTRNEVLAKKMTTEFGAALQFRDMTNQKQALELELAQVLGATSLTPEARWEAERTTNIVTGLAWAGGIGATVGVGWLVYKAFSAGPSSSRRSRS